MHGLVGNAPGIVGLFLLAVPVSAWILIVLKQYGYSRPKTYRVNVLIARTSFFLPTYAFFVWISLVEPQSFEGMQIAFSIIEAMSFYCFFAMIVANLGGATNAVKTMRAANKAPFCGCCCPSEPGSFYMRVYNSLWYMLWLRIPVITIATIAYYNNLNSLYLIATLVGLLILGNAFFSLINFYENLLEINMGHTWKLVFLKMSIGIIVIEGLLETILWQAGAFNNTDASSGYTQEGTVVRYFCLLLLVEYVVFSMAVWNVYSQDVTYVTFPDPHDPSFGALDYQQNIAQTGMPTTTASFSANPNRVSKHQSTSHSMDGEAPHKNICGFVYDVISFRDMWSIEHKLSVEISELSEPLNSSSASNL